VALDGVHPGRRAVIDFLMENPGAHATAAIAGHCRLPVTPTRRHLQDLNAHGVVELLVGDRPERWVTSTWLRENWWAVADPEPGGNP
jgi:predicted ArsR family transcriptional regulator